MSSIITSEQGLRAPGRAITASPLGSASLAKEARFASITFSDDPCGKPFSGAHSRDQELRGVV